ncbi:hypothetical protein SAMN02745202_00853 [Segatella oulorum]|uniref:Uncharacterized protein n=2 Tax=Segatella oulorum TaxID=28136 RepID=A0A1T4MV70_9BACT|nr:hypothetical protein SAMN02745202_00853 [Segatella oulorum]
MVGAVPVCPPERPRRGVSIRKGHVPSRKGGVSIRKEHVPLSQKRRFHPQRARPHPQMRCFHVLKCLCIAHDAHLLSMDAPLQGDTGGHTGTAPTNLHQTPLPRNLPCFNPSAEPLPATFAHETRKVMPFMKGLQLFFVILQPIVSITRKR